MRNTSLAFALSLLTSAIGAQNFVTNGDFSAGLTGWTLGGGYSTNPTVENFDVSGLGVSACFACSPGGQVTPPPYAPNTLEQTITFIPVVEYELSADICTKNENVSTSANVDAGRIAVEIGGLNVGNYNFQVGASGSSGNITGQWVWRAKLGLRVSTATGGALPLTFKFERSYLSNATTPRVRMTNIQLRVAQSQPTITFGDNFRMNRTLAFQVKGTANANYAIFAAPNLSTGPIQIPGINGSLWLNPGTVIYFLGGTLDASGFASTGLLVPFDPNLAAAPTYFQAIQVAGSSAALGFHHYIVFTTN